MEEKMAGASLLCGYRRQPVAEIDLYFRMEAGASWHADSDENLEIAEILNR